MLRGALAYGSEASGVVGLKSAQRTTGWGGYFWGNKGQRMKVEVFVRTYRGGAAHR